MKKTVLKNYLFAALVFAGAVLPVIPLVAIPAVIHAQTLTIPCTGPDCDFDKLVELGQNIMNFLILLSIPVSAIVAAWAGWQILSAGGNEGQLENAKEMLTKVLIGFFFILAAWLIVWLITSALLKSPDQDGPTNLLKSGSTSVNIKFA